MAIEIAWGWLRYQPRSALSRWYRRRVARGGPRARKVGIVALARRLLVELWRYREIGAVPQGAARKPEPRPGVETTRSVRRRQDPVRGRGAGQGSHFVSTRRRRRTRQRGTGAGTDGRRPKP